MCGVEYDILIRSKVLRDRMGHDSLPYHVGQVENGSR